MAVRQEPASMRALTVAHLRDRNSEVEVLFHESARIYRLRRSNPRFDAMRELLRRAAAERFAVDVQFGGTDGEDIVHATRMS
jgi:hypothetical protein